MTESDRPDAAYNLHHCHFGFVMKEILSPTRFADRKTYALRRMALAAARMLAASSLKEEIQAGLWAVAWAIAAGARSPARLGRRQPFLIQLPVPDQPRGTSADAMELGLAPRRRMICLPAIGDASVNRARPWHYGRRPQ